MLYFHFHLSQGIFQISFWISSLTHGWSTGLCSLRGAPQAPIDVPKQKPAPKDSTMVPSNASPQAAELGDQGGGPWVASAKTR